MANPATPKRRQVQAAGFYTEDPPARRPKVVPASWGHSTLRGTPPTPWGQRRDNGGRGGALVTITHRGSQGQHDRGTLLGKGYPGAGPLDPRGGARTKGPRGASALGVGVAWAFPTLLRAGGNSAALSLPPMARPGPLSIRFHFGGTYCRRLQKNGHRWMFSPNLFRHDSMASVGSFDGKLKKQRR